MLKANKTKVLRAERGTFAIVASRYNARYVDSMLNAAKATLSKAGAKIRIVRVPGAYEIPAVVAKLVRQSEDDEPLAAVICLGVILRGETVHAAHIGEAVTQALMQIQVNFQVPVVHEVLLLENERQAQKRCLDKKHNRGTEAAQTALEMSRVMSSLGGDKDS
jgi:6,7-dimethyl-8-ribityllumazine synthase